MNRHQIYAFWQFLLRKWPVQQWINRQIDSKALDKAEVKRELSDTVKAKKLADYAHTMRK